MKEGYSTSTSASAVDGDGDGENPQDILKGMATALSIDHWQPPHESKCEYSKDPSLSVNFLCMQPQVKEEEKSTPSSPPPAVLQVPLDKAEAARYQEIFLDLVGIECANLDAASPRHVLDDRFDSFLDTGERQFKDSLLEFLSKQSNEAKKTRAFRHMETMLRTQMGFRNTYSWSNRGIYARPTSSTPASNAPNSGGIANDNLSFLQHEETVDSASHNTETCESPGHVFICNSSVCDLQCDAFLCPAAISTKKGRLSGSIVWQWMKGVLDTNAILLDNLQHPQFNFQTYSESQSRIVSLQDWPWGKLQTSSSSLPFVVFGEVSLEKSKAFALVDKGTREGDLPLGASHVQFLMETARQFLDVAMAELNEHQGDRPHCHRQRFLLALPVLGTGGGFAGDLSGHVVEQLLIVLTDFVQKSSEVDIALVCADEATYTHAQTIRHKALQQQKSPKGLSCFHCFDVRQRQSAVELARLASGRQLALFLGAGISIGSGLPSWFGLLHIIEDYFTPTGAPCERSLGEKTKWDPLVMADELDEWCKARADRQGQQVSLKKRVCEYISNHANRPGLLLALLISIPCLSIVTQNYDQLIEKGCQSWNLAANLVWDEEASSKKRLSVIPYRPRRSQNSRHWLLKMHGCVTAPNEIVLTSQDYEESSSRSKTLAGLVQASLMTQHLLFVGYSLSDPNYLAIIDQVRSALRPYGTSS